MIDIETLVAEYGVNNLRFFIPMQAITPLHGLGLPIGMVSSDDPYVTQECVIDERRYKVLDGYKIELRALASTPESYYGSETFYIMDFESLNRQRPDDYRVYVLVDEDNKYQRLA